MAHGQINHIEIPADDPERARRWYKAVAGWDTADSTNMPNYWLFRFAEGFGGAIGKRGETAGQHLRDYLEVDSIDEALAASDANGGRTAEPKNEIPGVGWFAVVHDSEGNELGLFQTSRQG
jgi:predicted enzyme related to lactoylglutathione lyase